MSDRQVALAGLLRVAEPHDELASYVQDVGPFDAWEEILERRAPAEILSMTRRATGSRAQLQRQAELDLEVASKAGMVLIGRGDAGWPWQLPGHSGLVAPIALYRRGPAWPMDGSRAVAIVGSRAATAYGLRVANDLASELADSEKTIVSGAAFGIDAAAHRGALSLSSPVAQPPTIAVVACGADVTYPTSHRDLFDLIASKGSVISEYPPGTRPTRERFLRRNRIIAMFAGAVVVVEAAKRSGALNAARHARELNRPVYAVPGPVTSAASAGCHQLIQDGDAVLATCAADIH